VSGPTYLVRDNDGAYGHVFTRRVMAMGIRDRPISRGSPWQNGHVERPTTWQHKGFVLQKKMCGTVGDEK
jgi:hypothetical protein